jgi:prepilin-type N-terminal cleavage/methylation domain-containing protein
MKSQDYRAVRNRQQGFTMIELIVSVAILTIVAGVVVSGLNGMVQRNAIETAKVDLTQESREFLDQIVSDIHQAGYPSIKMFDPAAKPLGLNDPGIASGFVNVTASSLQFEADVDGSGTVSEVFIQLNPLNGPCPCIIQRGTISKAAWQGGTLPTYYTEVDNVQNTAVFQGYDNAGNNVVLGGAPPANLAAIEITLNVRSPKSDTNGLFPTVTMTTSAKVANLN